jgi:hypothetical protein
MYLPAVSVWKKSRKRTTFLSSKATQLLSYLLLYILRGIKSTQLCSSRLSIQQTFQGVLITSEIT